MVQLWGSCQSCRKPPAWRACVTTPTHGDTPSWPANILTRRQLSLDTATLNVHPQESGHTNSGTHHGTLLSNKERATGVHVNMDKWCLGWVEWNPWVAGYTLHASIHTESHGSRNSSLVTDIRKWSGKEGGLLRRGTWELFGVMKMFYIFLWTVAPEVYTVIRTQWTEHVGVCGFYCTASTITPQIKHIHI